MRPTALPPRSERTPSPPARRRRGRLRRADVERGRGLRDATAICTTPGRWRVVVVDPLDHGHQLQRFVGRFLEDVLDLAIDLTRFSPDRFEATDSLATAEVKLLMVLRPLDAQRGGRAASSSSSIGNGMVAAS